MNIYYGPSQRDFAIHKEGTSEFVVCSPAELRRGIQMGMSVSQGGAKFHPDERFDQPHTEWKAAWVMEQSCAYGDGVADDHIDAVCDANNAPRPADGQSMYMACADVLIRSDTNKSLDDVMKKVVENQLRYFSRVSV